MLEIYHVPLTRSVRVLWLCEELGLPYRTIPVDFSPAYRASEEWRALNPVGKVPVLRDGELQIFESGAMLQYVLQRYGNGALQPAPDASDYGLFLQWCWFAEATFARPVGEVVNHRRAFDKKAYPDVIEEMTARSQLCCDALDEALANQRYLVGDEFGAADIMTGYTLLLAERMTTVTFAANLQTYWQRLQSRAAYQAATTVV